MNVNIYDIVKYNNVFSYLFKIIGVNLSLSINKPNKKTTKTLAVKTKHKTNVNNANSFISLF